MFDSSSANSRHAPSLSYPSKPQTCFLSFVSLEHRTPPSPFHPFFVPLPPVVTPQEDPEMLTLCSCGVNKTFFHYSCLLQWLSKHSYCPACRCGNNHAHRFIRVIRMRPAFCIGSRIEVIVALNNTRCCPARGHSGHERSSLLLFCERTKVPRLTWSLKPSVRSTLQHAA